MAALARGLALMCTIAWYLTGVVAWGLYVSHLQEWLGWFFAVVVGIVLAPGAVVFPVVYWFVEDYWPITYLYVLGTGFVLYLFATALHALAKELQ